MNTKSRNNRSEIVQHHKLNKKKDKDEDEDRGGVRASQPAAPGLILGIPKNSLRLN